MRRLLFAVVSVVVLGFIGILGWGLARQQSGTEPLLPAPDFTLTAFDGETISLADLRGSPVVLNFWASWCLPCREEAPLLEAGWRTYKDEGVAFIGVNIWDAREDALRFMEEFSITYPNAPDIDGRVTTSYRITGVPTTFFISRDGMVIGSWTGALTSRAMATYIEQIKG